ncbi:MAG: YjjG family noncanonical pyrimidine nucleotidase [Oscillospiraceae bacterium]|nr:YjjG family noncanonical pyrimidine nucleotidase [Oscillospiraceae bacterium]
MKTAPCVLLDLDDTILDFRKAEHRALARSLSAFGIASDEQILSRYSEINKQYWERLEDGLLTREQVLVGRFQELLYELGASADASQLRDTYERNLSEGHFFVDGAEELLELLQDRYRLFLISNGTAVVQEGRLASAGISHCFEQIFISEKVGANKPDRVFFERCFEQIPGFDREQSIVVGDSLTSDIRGGINAGVKTCWFNLRRLPARQDIVPDYRIDRLEELPPLLETIFRSGKCNQ